MKERLDQLTLSQFIDLICGDFDALLAKHEIGNAEKLAIATRNIVFEYRSIADAAGMTSYLQHIESWIKAKMSVMIFTMCFNLTTLNQYEKAREVIKDYGLYVSGWTDARTHGAVKAKLGQFQRELEDLEKDREGMAVEADKIRSQFDAQTAALMAHFKFQIDPATIKASIYANLVGRYHREIKAQMAAINKR